MRGRGFTTSLLIGAAVHTHGQSTLNPCQKSLVQQATNSYENSQTYFAFDYCENINDGRGYTAGIVGFCTGTHDAFAVISAYTRMPGHGDEFAPYLSTLAKLNESSVAINGNTKGLDGFCVAWWNAAKNVQFRKAQVDQMELTYYTPSQVLAVQLGLDLPVAWGQLYDAGIQHGFGADDPDSLPSMAARTTSSLGGSPASSSSPIISTAWITAFMAERKKTLCQPANQASQSAWCQSISRVTSYQYILARTPSFNDSVTILDNDGQSLALACDLGLTERFIPGPYPGDNGSSSLPRWAIAVIIVGLVLVVGVVGYLLYMHCYAVGGVTGSKRG